MNSKSIRIFEFRFNFLDKYNLFKAFNKIMNSDTFISGRAVSNFEEQFGNLTQASNVVSCGNGLDALTISLRALGVNENSRVAVSSHTFFATWLAIMNVGAEIIGVDCELDSGQISISELQRVYAKEKFDTLVAVHMHGIALDIKPIQDFCKKHEIKLVEDCAQAHGLFIENMHVGTFGNLGAFSFYPTKNLPALGDGGAIITNDQELGFSCLSLANYGWLKNNRSEHVIRGLNSRLDSIQAAFLSIHLTKLSVWNARRRKIAQKYMMALSNKKSVRVLGGKTNNRVWHHFPIVCDDRTEIIAYLNKNGIDSQIHYPVPCHKQKAYLDYCAERKHVISMNLPNTEKISAKILSIPLHQWLKRREVNRVIKVLALID